MDLISQCALQVAKVVWRPGHGGFAFTVVCKATFELQPDVSPLATAQELVLEADVYTGEGGGLALASDLVPFKKRPEVLVVGHAYAPDGRAVPSLVARLVVGEINKAIQVVGDRSFDRYGQLSDPAPFTRMPLVWERAASGLDMSNPVGRPGGDAARADTSGHAPAPNLLPTELRLTSRSDIVPPVGFGPIAPSWPSRAACLHRNAAWWNPSRWYDLPLPASIDLEYFNAAAPDQQRALPFGEEEIYLEHLHPRFARLSTRLAPVTPTVTADHGSGPQPLQLRCDTLVIDTDRGLAMLVWRAHVLLDHPDQPGRVVVTGPVASEVVLPAWAQNVSEAGATLVPGAFILSSAVLPFSDAAAPTPGSGLPPPVTSATVAAPAAAEPPHGVSSIIGGTTPPLVDPVITKTLDPGLTLGAAALPFASSQSKSAPLREVSREESASALPPVSYSTDEEDIEKTLVPALGLPASVLPFASSQGGNTAWHRAPSMENASALLPMSSPADGNSDGPVTPRCPNVPNGTLAQASGAPWMVNWESLSAEAQHLSTPAPPWVEVPALPSPVAPPPSPTGETPVPPPLLGAIATILERSSEAGDRESSPAAQAGPLGEAPTAEPEPDVAFDAYPPERCGAIAARLTCDESAAGDILRAEDLDAAQWQRVHEYWLDRIRDEAARSRKKLLSDYDGAYVSALEAKRGTIALDDYARLAEAAERSAVAGALAERGLPEGAWPHVHRVWIGHMVMDVRLGKQVRSIIDALRSGVG